MAVTGQPLVELGMITAPPGPVYLVMVIAPLLVTNWNWACNAAGGVNSNSGSSHVAQAVLKRVEGLLEQGVLAKLQRPLLNTPPHL
jgi:hypothetical protein